MKKIVKPMLAVFLTASLFSSYAQCTKKTDDMTKAVTVETKLEKIGTSNQGMNAPMFIHASIDYHQNTGHYILYLQPEFRDIQTLQENSKVLVKLDDESLLEFVIDKTSISNNAPGTPVVQNGTIWYNTLAFVLTDDQLSRLKSKKVVKIRCGINDYVVKGKSQIIISEGLACIDKTK